jgi:GIY-YIG catalytic domain
MTLALRTRNLFYQSKNYAFSTNPEGVLFFIINKKNKCFIPIDVRAFSTLRAPTKSDRFYSTDSSGLAVFSDADKDKLNILKYVNGKSGIYLWTNKLNDKKYVGSSLNLRRRLLEYYNVNRLLNEKSMPINVALLKYGYTNFSLTILEICNQDSLMFREKHFFEVYSPEYNILKTPGSPDRGSG